MRLHKFEAERIDAESGEPVDVNTLAETYELSDRIGICLNQVFDPEEVEAFTEVILSEDMAFNVPDAELAETFRLQDPAHTVIIPEADGCRVIRAVEPASARASRQSYRSILSGSFLKALNPRVWDSIAYSWSRLTPSGSSTCSQPQKHSAVLVWSLKISGLPFTHPGSRTQQWDRRHARLRRLYADSALDQNTQGECPPGNADHRGRVSRDVLYGGYGSMINPVAACATAAVSVEVAADILRAGKTDLCRCWCLRRFQ